MKKDFPIFESNPDLVFLNSASTTQKPSSVIDATQEFISSHYDSIHRGGCTLSEDAEKRYLESKEKVGEWIGASPTEIVYTYSATYASNILTQSLAESGILQAGDTVILGIAEHHSAIVPWMIAQEHHGFHIRWLPVGEDFRYDLDALRDMLDDSTKVISLQYASNVTGAVQPLEKVRAIIGNERYFITDATQMVPHGSVDFSSLDVDAAFFTGHKMCGYTGIGVLYAKKSLLQALEPAIGGGGSINFVTEEGYEAAGLPNRWEPGTPNVIGAVSLQAAIEYLQSAQKEDLIQYSLDKFAQLEERGLKLYGPKSSQDRIGVFSFSLPEKHVNDIADVFDEHNICLRSGHHCCGPLHENWGIKGTVRMSLYLHNDQADVDRFFEVLEGIL